MYFSRGQFVYKNLFTITMFIRAVIILSSLTVKNVLYYSTSTRHPPHLPHGCSTGRFPLGGQIGFPIHQRNVTLVFWCSCLFSRLYLGATEILLRQARWIGNWVDLFILVPDLSLLYWADSILYVLSAP